MSVEFSSTVVALPGLAAAIRVEHEQVERHARSAVEHAVRCGELLLEAKTQCCHGHWLPWLEANFPDSEWTARNWMRLARNRERVLGLPTIRAALAELAEPREERERRGPLPVDRVVELDRAEPDDEAEDVDAEPVPDDLPREPVASSRPRAPAPAPKLTFPDGVSALVVSELRKAVRALQDAALYADNIDGDLAPDARQEAYNARALLDQVDRALRRLVEEDE
jgi:hypothetical protein